MTVSRLVLPFDFAYIDVFVLPPKTAFRLEQRCASLPKGICPQVPWITKSLRFSLLSFRMPVLRRGIVSRVTAGLIEGHHNDTGKPRGVDVPASIEYENVGFCFFGGTLEL